MKDISTEISNLLPDPWSSPFASPKLISGTGALPNDG